MNRRNFLRLFGAGLPAVVVAEKIGLIERVRSYFFAPAGGWKGLTVQEALALQLEAFAPYIAKVIETDQTLAEQMFGPHFIDGIACFQHDDHLRSFRGLGRKPYRTPVSDAGTFMGMRVIVDPLCPPSEVHLRQDYPKIDFDRALLIG
jgi:hypothetical protein